ncbi:MAG: hypothetical protein KBC26_03520 [Candidatus Pacebacteria bacterium]|nr:hypothetical protein [Candidatus Paceibacterota bacterium]
MYKGVIVENSLADKNILNQLDIQKTYVDDDWILHNVLISEDQIFQLAKCLTDGPWYIHFWQDENDDILVVFKDKTFRIKKSDTSTWSDAISHGKSIGISQEQLDFKISW